MGNVVLELQNGILSLYNDVAVTIFYSGLSKSFKPGSIWTIANHPGKFEYTMLINN